MLTGDVQIKLGQDFKKFMLLILFVIPASFFVVFLHNKKPLIKFLADMLKIFQWQN